MSITVKYPNGRDEIVDIDKFNPEDYSEWDIDDYVLEDNAVINLRFTESVTKIAMRDKLKDAGLDTAVKLYELQTDNKEIQDAKDYLWGKIKNFGFRDYLRLTSLHNLPANLETLSLIGSTNLTTLEGCPKSITSLDLSYCSSITSLKHCPEGVKDLYLGQCTSLKSLEGCPPNLERLHLVRNHSDIDTNTNTFIRRRRLVKPTDNIMRLFLKYELYSLSSTKHLPTYLVQRQKKNKIKKFLFCI